MDLIKRKNLRATKGKQRWRRNIDVSALTAVINQEPINMPGRNDNKPLLSFTIDTEKKNIYEDKDRFKKKPIDPKLLSKVEKKKIKALEKRLEVMKSVEEEPQPQLNIWEEEKISKRKQQEELDRPKFIIKPLNGQSYNPAEEEHEKLFEKIIQEETREKQVFKRPDRIEKYNVLEAARKEKLKLRKIEKEQGKKAIEDLIEKQKNHSFHLVKQLKKEQREEEEKMKRRASAKAEEHRKEQEAFSEGRMIKPKKMGKRVIPIVKEDVAIEVPDKLRKVEPKDRLLRNQFDSYYRRGLLEPRLPSNKLRISRLPRYRIRH